MTSKLQMSSRTSTLSSSPSAITKAAAVRDLSPSSPHKTKPMESMKSLYQADQQVKFLHLQAEVESLLIQLQVLKQQRQEEVRPALSSYANSVVSRHPVASGVSPGLSRE